VTGTTSRVGDATPSGSEVKQTTRRAAGVAKENPLGLAIGAVATGFLAGLAMPSTRVEDEKLGPVAEQVRDKVKETGQEAVERGKQVAQEVASTATETAKQQTREQGQELAESTRQSAQEVRGQAQQNTRP
jgi:flagellar motor protein MotB